MSHRETTGLFLGQRTKPSTHADFTYAALLIDIMPTCMDMTGATYPETHKGNESFPWKELAANSTGQAVGVL